MVNPLDFPPTPAKWHVLMLRISWVVAVFLLLTALSGCAEEQPGSRSLNDAGGGKLGHPRPFRSNGGG